MGWMKTSELILLSKLRSFPISSYWKLTEFSKWGNQETSELRRWAFFSIVKTETSKFTITIFTSQKLNPFLFSNILNKQQSYDMQHWHINKNTDNLIFFTGCNKAVKMKNFVNMMTYHFQWKQLDDHGLVPGNLTSDVTVPAGCVLQLRPLGIPSPDPWMLYIS